MPVDDSGTEALRKAAEPTTLNNRSNYYFKVMDQNSFAPPNGTDSFTVTYPSATQEVYQFRSGGIGGTILKTVTLNYTDATKTALTNGVIS